MAAAPEGVKRVFVYGGGLFRVPDAPLGIEDEEMLEDLVPFYTNDPLALRNLESLNQGTMRSKDGTTKISVRTLDWFLVNYSLDHRPTITIPSPVPEAPNRQRIVKVYNACENATQKFTSERFQRFRRGPKVQFVLPPLPGENAKAKTCFTVVGQLNFFAWALRNGIMDYVAKHAVAIKADEASKRAKHRAEVSAEKEAAKKKGHPAARAHGRDKKRPGSAGGRGVGKPRKRNWLTPGRAPMCNGVNLEALKVSFGKPGALPIAPPARSDSAPATSV